MCVQEDLRQTKTNDSIFHWRTFKYSTQQHPCMWVKWNKKYNFIFVEHNGHIIY